MTNKPKNLLYLILSLLLTSEIFAMNASNEKETQKIKPLLTIPPKCMFWTQGEDGNAILKPKPFIIDVNNPQLKITTTKELDIIKGSISTQESSFEDTEEDEILNKFLHMPYNEQKNTWKQFVAHEVDKKYCQKLNELNQELLNKDVEKIKLLLSRGVDISVITESFGVSEEFVKLLK